MAMTYSVLYFSHQLAAACAGSCWIVLLDVLDGKRRTAMVIVAGLLAGLALLVDYQAVFAVVPVAVYAAYRLRGDVPQLARIAALGIAGAALPVAVLLVYHDACFGSPWRTGYDASTSFAMYHQVGFLGLDRPRWEAFRGSLFAFDNGLFTLSPWILLAISGANEMIRRPRRAGDRGIAITCLGVMLVYVVFISSINFWRGGGAVGPRYITAMLPFALPLVAAHLEVLRARPQFLGAIASSIFVGVFIYALSSATFPYWPDSVKNPVRDITVQLLVDGYVGPNLGDTFGLGGVLGIIPYLLVVFGAVGWVIHRLAGRRGLVLSVAIALVMLGAYMLVPGGTPNHEYDYVRDLLTP
jgi:hypothetical protein